MKIRAWVRGTYDNYIYLIWFIIAISILITVGKLTYSPPSTTEYTTRADCTLMAKIHAKGAERLLDRIMYLQTEPIVAKEWIKIHEGIHMGAR